MASDPVEPEACLRSLTAEALLQAERDRPLFPLSLALMATSNAFVMLGLLPEPQAGAILAELRLALERKGFRNVGGVTAGELTVRPGAYEYWQARTAGPARLREVPLSVTAAGVHCPTSVADVCFEWVRLAAAGLRLSFHATAPDPGGDLPAPDVPMRQALSEISLTDDSGHSYDWADVSAGGGRGRDRQEWHGDALVDLDPARKPAWLSFSPTSAGASARVSLPLPAQVPVGAGAAPWSTAAECYLAALGSVTKISVNEAVARPEDTAEIVATVADSDLGRHRAAAVTAGPDHPPARHR